MLQLVEKRLHQVVQHHRQNQRQSQPGNVIQQDNGAQRGGDHSHPDDRVLQAALTGKADFLAQGLRKNVRLGRPLHQPPETARNQPGHLLGHLESQTGPGLG